MQQQQRTGYVFHRTLVNTRVHTKLIAYMYKMFLPDDVVSLHSSKGAPQKKFGKLHWVAQQT